MNSSNPLVSVIVPLKNVEKYISDALRSILAENQIDMEVIVVDDKSIDGSLQRVLRLQDERIRVIRGPGRGISACMNVGIAVAAGSVIMRCDADDIYPAGRIGRQVRWLEANPEYDSVCGAFSAIDHKGRLIAQMRCGAAPAEITAELVSGKTRTHLCTYAIRASLIAKAGRFREYFESAEDIDFQLRMGEAGRVAYLPEDWYYYRINASSITHTQSKTAREYFEAVAFDLQRQRRSFGFDQLQKGCPPPKPNSDVSAASSSAEHIAGLLVGRAWSEHRSGKKIQALRSGFRALAANPLRVCLWKNLIVLILKGVRLPSLKL
jgi:glycosyltransferase involved in cell wall biosynthesis